ncbi:MAG TPA: type II toxin-antitoxin system VapC family toxin [Oscillatoriales cyanobacterium M59_W2019_021]|nr:MAG: type II toxin-antitoxin system VapC family toxin [Cyanobacteria bacterium J055]HIK30650.1 type II toxin-antitoxin system VapC family toxin [Oscillatoriales cyanobacterium M4454_W2019_049]HIK51984.1 type II toxin-antitoxin system VapC family toxin [Oscillatoriales cyanobacterium M59_W2019_021]
MTFLLDTNIISELFRPEPNVDVLAWRSGISRIFISVITLDEISYGLTAKPNARVRSLFDRLVNTSCEVLSVTAEIAQLAGELRGQLRLQGKPRTQADMLIAATARVHQLTLVTRNMRDFEDCHIQLFNPFQS